MWSSYLAIYLNNDISATMRRDKREIVKKNKRTDKAKKQGNQLQ